MFTTLIVVGIILAAALLIPLGILVVGAYHANAMLDEESMMKLETARRQTQFATRL